MMEHITMHDWYENKSALDEIYFVEEHDLDHCSTEKILRNHFFDPLVSSDSDDEVKPNKINWDEIFKKNKQHLKDKLFVPGLRPPPAYPKVSEMNSELHNQILKIISVDYPNVLKDLHLHKPTRSDFKVYEAAKETYLKEQKEFKEWAKSLWVTDHCIRALRPKPAVERVYEAEFKVKAQRMQALPKHYNVAAQITLKDQVNKCDAVFKQDLIRVTLAEMPTVQIPDRIEKQLSIIRPCTVPEPCQKHPYQIVLPNEDALSMLPITEIHRELATFALDNNAHFIASENALKCLTQWNRHWLLPLSVSDTVGPDGNRVNVMVLDSEFSVHKEAAPMRTYKAFRHLLENTLIPSSEKHRIWEIRASRTKMKEKKTSALTTASTAKLNAKPAATSNVQDPDISSDDEDNHLYIDTGEDLDMAQPKLTEFGSPKRQLDSTNASCLSPKAGLPSQNGYHLRNTNCLSPKAGLTSPNASITPPKAGFSSPNRGVTLSNSGYALRNATCLSPKAGSASSNGGIASNSGYALRNATCLSPKAGFSPSKASITSPRAGFVPPKLGLSSPKADFASPNGGFISPTTSIESPKELSFGPTPAKQMRGNNDGSARRSARLCRQDSASSLPAPASSKSTEECPTVPDIGVYSCTCKDTVYEKPPRRSFRKWQFRKEGTNEKHDIIIHSPHKAKDKTGELLIEPLPEYQIDLGASEQTPDAVRSAALSLALRKNASLLNVRVDGPTGDIVTFEKMTTEAFAKKHPDVMKQVISTVHTALSQLQELRPGHYVLQHDPSHGPNAMLMCPGSPRSQSTLSLNFDAAQLLEVDEAHMAKIPPTITTTLLPFHKHRRTLPCAFTPYENMVTKESKKPQPKKKAPPQAIKLKAEELHNEPRRKVSRGYPTN